MTPERAQQIRDLFDAVHDASPDQRSALLSQADPEIRREVESLLSARGGEMFERPAIKDTPYPLEDLTLTQTPTGAQIGPYRIEGKLGEGGMGEVFRAMDTRLHRAVALKIAHAQFDSRFEREARTIASLNHPNICTLYDVGPHYLVMELVEGETLAARLKRGPLDLESARRYGLQIAAALVEAHSKGIVHRDLKPGNIMIGKSGVKVLDFGLAKSAEDETQTPSRMIIGTPAYMSPEQREGKPADARSDIYSFGCVLYEISTGARPGPQRKRLASPRLEMIVGRCLEDNPLNRWQSVTEIERELEAVSSPSGRWKYVASIAISLAALVSAAYFYSSFRTAPNLTDKDTIVLAEFENRTHEDVFDETLRQGLAVQLEQSPYLSLISDERIQNVLGLMEQKPDVRLTAQLAREVCERAGSTVVLDGSIAKLGAQYVLGLRARNCHTGEMIGQQQAQAAGKEDVLRALGQIANALRSRIGESLLSLQKYSTPLEQASTQSLEALKAYSMARRVAYSRGKAAAIPVMKHAIELDPNFAIAHAQLALWSEGSPLAMASAKEAYRLRDRATERERLFIMVNYDMLVTGNVVNAYETCHLWTQTYPRDKEPHGILSSLVSQMLGKYEESIGESNKAIAVDPDFPPGYVDLAWSNLFLNRIGEAEKALQLADQRKLEFEDFFVLHYYIAFLKGDRAAMDRAAASGQGKDGVADWLLTAQSAVEAYYGHLQQARATTRRAVELARQGDQKDKVAIYEAGAAVREAFYGNGPEAIQRATASLAISRSRDPEYGAAFALGLAKESNRVRVLADDLEKRFPEDTLVRFTYVPVLRAVIALNAGQPQQAIDLLQASLPYDFGWPGTAFGFFGLVYPAYVRGEALQSMSKNREAAAEFQKILDHPGLVFADIVSPMARLQKARTLALSGSKSDANRAYQDLLKLWKNADSDIPAVKQAGAEYGRLQ
jgi:serine/threonine protein kinase/tetratricopeptide (TPR) repeat protein